MLSHAELVAFFAPYTVGPFAPQLEAFNAARDVEGRTPVPFLARYQAAWTEAKS